MATCAMPMDKWSPFY